jgi:molybdopterin converting factor small subunit
MNSTATVLFFATLREKAGVRETHVEFPAGASIGDLKALYLSNFLN